MNELIIRDILIGAAGDGMGGLIAGTLAAAGKRIARKYGSKPKEKALQQALEVGLQAAFSALPKETSKLTQYYLECLANFLQRTVVHQRLYVLRFDILPSHSSVHDSNLSSCPLFWGEVHLPA